ncbi:MAG: hypothetical protein ACI91R_002512, partial [Vicingaceae bacterium]
MSTFLTDNINISVRPLYEEAHSVPSSNDFVFSYAVTVKNKGEITVQLL